MMPSTINIKALFLAFVAIISLYPNDAPATDQYFDGIGRSPSDPLKADNYYFENINEVDMILYQDGLFISTLPVYNNRGKYLVPVSKLVSIFGGDREINHESQKLKMDIPILGINARISKAEKKIFYVDGSDDLPPDAIFFYDDEAYLDARFIEDIFSIILLFDIAKQTIKIEISEDVENKQEIINKIRNYVSEDNNIKVKKNYDELPDSLILGLIINKTPMAEFIEVMKIDESLYIPMEELSYLLDFPMEVDTEGKRLNGWYISENNSLELKNNKLNIRGNELDLTTNEIQYLENDIYINREVFYKYGGINFIIDSQTMTLTVASQEAFPFEKKVEREIKKAKLLAKKDSQNQDKYQKLDSPYTFYSPPIADININNNYNKNSNPRFDSNYSLIAKGDLGYMLGEVFSSGNLNEGEIDFLRLRFGREDMDGQLLGPLKATEFSFGDIFSYSLPLVANGGFGRGVKVSNRSLSQPTQFDTTDFIGVKGVGYDVELYRNNALLDFQTIGDDGRYEFRDVPVLYGKNEFRLVFYGPQGQIDEEVEVLNINNSILQEDEFTYNASIDQKSREIFEFDDGNSQLRDISSDPRAIFSFEYGLKNWLTLNADIAQVPLRNKVHRYLNLGFKANYGDFLANVNGACDIVSNGCAFSAALATEYNDYSIQLRHVVSENFISENNSDINDQSNSKTFLNLNKQYYLPYVGQFTASLSASNERSEDGQDKNKIDLRLNNNIYGINLSNKLSHEFGEDNNEKTSGEIAAKGKIENMILGLNVDYDVKPETEVKSVELSNQVYFNKNIVNKTTVSKSFQGRGLFEVENSLTLKNPHFSTSFNARVNDDDNYFIGLNFNFSLAQVMGTDDILFQSTPFASNGSVIAKAFYDDNYNGIRDENEEFHEDASFKLRNTDMTKSEDKSYSYKTNLSLYKPVVLTYDTDSLEDPMIVPAVEGYSLYPRPGYMQVVEMPLIKSSEIDGFITKTKSGSDYPARNTTVKLLDKNNNLIAETKTEFDGYYLFTKVIPGIYKLKTEEDGWDQEEILQVDIKEADFYTGYEIALISQDDEEQMTFPEIELASNDFEEFFEGLEVYGPEIPVYGPQIASNYTFAAEIDVIDEPQVFEIMSHASSDLEIYGPEPIEQMIFTAREKEIRKKLNLLLDELSGAENYLYRENTDQQDNDQQYKSLDLILNLSD